MFNSRAMVRVRFRVWFRVRVRAGAESRDSVSLRLWLGPGLR